MIRFQIRACPVLDTGSGMTRTSPGFRLPPEWDRVMDSHLHENGAGI
jgi:hypothetical protein